MIKLYLSTIREQVNLREINAMTSLVPSIRLKKINSFWNRDDSLRSLYAEVMIRILTGRAVGVRPHDIVIERDRYGKPYFKDFPNLYFSISHSGDWIVCALSDRKCGVDIEKKEQFYIDIARCFYSENEYEMIMSAEEGLRKELFYDLWTLKESYMKFDGRGLMIPLGDIEFRKEDGRYWLVRERRLYFKHIEYIPGYKIALCTVSEEIETNFISLCEMIKIYI